MELAADAVPETSAEGAPGGVRDALQGPSLASERPTKPENASRQARCRSDGRQLTDCTGGATPPSSRRGRRCGQGPTARPDRSTGRSAGTWRSPQPRNGRRARVAAGGATRSLGRWCRSSASSGRFLSREGNPDGGDVKGIARVHDGDAPRRRVERCLRDRGQDAARAPPARAAPSLREKRSSVAPAAALRGREERQPCRPNSARPSRNRRKPLLVRVQTRSQNASPRLRRAAA
jgi:hypothetical protein